MPRTNRSIHSLLFHLAISSVPMLTAFPASAVLVTINTVEYDVSLFEGSYDNNSSLFQAPPAGYMPWWSDPSGNLASAFALQVYDSLGSGSDVGSGPVFAYLYDSGTGSVEGWVQSLTDPNAQDIRNPSRDAAVKYAIVNPAPVPLPLPVFGAIAALHVSKRLRQSELTHRSSFRPG